MYMEGGILRGRLREREREWILWPAVLWGFYDQQRVIIYFHIYGGRHIEREAEGEIEWVNTVANSIMRVLWPAEAFPYIFSYLYLWSGLFRGEAFRESKGDLERVNTVANSIMRLLWPAEAFHIFFSYLYLWSGLFRGRHLERVRER